MSKRRHDSEIIYVEIPLLRSDRFGVILPEPEWYEGERTRTTVEPNPCMMECGDPGCREWINVLIIPGSNRKEVMKNLVAGKRNGFWYHVSECQMEDGVLPF